MEMSPRLKQILSVLLKETEIVSVTQLAKVVHVSKRTVQRELEDVDSPLRKYGLILRTKPGKGIWLEGSYQQKQQLLNQIDKNVSIDTSDKEDRRKRLILEILKDREPKKIYYYSNILQVSEATVSGDMEAVESWFERFDLQLIRRQGYGVVLEGEERNYRQAMRQLLEENIERKRIRFPVHEQETVTYDSAGGASGKNIYDLLNQDIFNQVILCFHSIHDSRIGKLTDNSYLGLILHITIALDRILKGEFIETDEVLLKRLYRDGDFELANVIVHSLEEQFQIKIPDMELAHLYLHLKGAKYQTAEIEEYGLGQPEKREEILAMVDQMIEVYDKEVAFELKQDQDFIEGLAAHLQPTLVRIRNYMVISNPLLEEIKEKYPVVYEKCKKVADILAVYCSYPVPESEIGFLAMHFGAAMVRLENKKENIRKVRIGIICASGIGISRLMQTKLAGFLKHRAVLSTYGKEDIDQSIIDQTDFFVSSIVFDDTRADIVLVSPLLTESSLEYIDKKVRTYARIPKKQKSDSDFPDQLETINYIACEIKRLLNEFSCVKVEADIGFEELIIAVSESLLLPKEKQIVIVQDLMRREALATQIVPEYGFALLHARTEGVMNPSFLVFLTKDGDMFQDPYFKRIFAVIIMLMPDHVHVEENKEILGYLSSRLIENEEFLTVIFNGIKQEIKDLLTAELHQFFYRYLDYIRR